jgi:hypothetical protein
MILRDLGPKVSIGVGFGALSSPHSVVKERTGEPLGTERSGVARIYY